MLISICIPVYNGEKYLRRCLNSIASQDFKDYEVIVVDDCSTGVDEHGWNCKKICKIFSKETKIKVNYIQNRKNLGCIEARRNAVYEAKGKYILCVDCDDALEPGCLSTLAAKANDTNADIIQSGAKTVFANDENQVEEHSESDLKNKEAMDEKVNRLFEGELKEKELFECSVIEHKINFFLWGKLIKRDVFISAWEMIPPCYCVWGEDYVIYFFITYFARSYVGIKDKLYAYSIDTGISSNLRIDTLERWEKICSVSSAFSIIFDSINNGTTTVTSEQRSAIQRQCNTYVLSTYRYLQHFVAEDLKKEAYNLLCDYWGSEYVQKIIEAAGEST